ncbi:hypothetical protein J7E50_10700 [Pedobacter sp. ISL-68]|uniref:hypothetical protein n=1 Tax=unclassified Pedobacter TaxID=2628915 RepID=UPI001BE9D3FD|nr:MULTISPECIES: hypothetical protein [unclassified Pedobacter]MBT2561299.1 hypothetical protein [Pedobacter sp. ISL-64]MBT2590689.1 hypothetical protein [Pedobacter sp. ISL-68]
MARKLPEIELGATIFLFDVAFAELRQKDDPLNTISFYDMKNMGSHYEAKYSPAHKCISEYGEDTILIHVPQMVHADPEGIALKYNMAVADLPEFDRDLRCSEALFQERIQGRLPLVKIGADDYTVDWRLKEIRLFKEPWKNISLRDLDMNRTGDKYLFFYHPPSKSKVDLTEDITQMPLDVILVALPFELHIDPVAVAREHDLDERTFVNFYPVQQKVEVPLYPLSVTGIPKRIEENLLKQKSVMGKGMGLN